MKVLDLFSGIGGFSLGLFHAGMETISFCEIDPYCRKVLKKHWPDIPIHEDIKKLNGEDYYGTIDLVCGGYPCQPFSLAGKQKGENDPRHLWPEMLRIIRGCRPRWVICENVYGHIKLGFDNVATSLENEGFTIWPFIIPACAVGAPHRRDRIWIVAHTHGNGCRKRSLRHQRKHGQTPGAGMSTFSSESSQIFTPMANSSSKRQSRSREYKQSMCPEKNKKWETNKFVAECFDRKWVVEPNVGRVANGVPRRMDRLRSLGNSVVPKIPYLIGKTILEYENTKTIPRKRT